MRSLSDLIDPDCEKEAAEYTFLESIRAAFGQKIVKKTYDLNKRLSTSLARSLQALSGLSETEMSYVWIALGALSAADVAAQFLSGDLLLAPAIALITAIFWNLNDSVATVPSFLQLICQGQWLQASISFVGAAQMAGATIAATLYEYASTSALATIGASGAAILTSGSFAVATIACYLNEEIKVAKCDKHLKQIQAELAKPESTDQAEYARKQRVLNHVLLIETAQRNNCRRNANAYAACAVVMVVVAVVAYIALSGATFGALPAVTVLALLATVAVGSFREGWVRQVDYVTNAKKSLIPLNMPLSPVNSCHTLNSASSDNSLKRFCLKSEKENTQVSSSETLNLSSSLSNNDSKDIDVITVRILSSETITSDSSSLETPVNQHKSLYNRLLAILAEKNSCYDFNKEVHIKTYGFFYPQEKTLTFGAYLKELAYKNPAKLKEIILVLETKVSGDVQIALAIKQHPYWDLLRCKHETLGSQLFSTSNPPLSPRSSETATPSSSPK